MCESTEKTCFHICCPDFPVYYVKVDSSIIRVYTAYRYAYLLSLIERKQSGKESNVELR